jgi:glutamate-ammonia-ligase adenylyltransferase
MNTEIAIERIIDEDLSQEEAQFILTDLNFEDWHPAWLCFQRLARQKHHRSAFEQLLPSLLLTLKHVASPERALVNLEHFLDRVQDPLQLLNFLSKNPNALERLIILFAGSQFLSEILLNNPEYFEQISERRQLAQPLTLAQYREKTGETVKKYNELEAQLNGLRRFQKLELLRIGASDLFGLMDLQTVTAQLSFLADSLIYTCLALIKQDKTMPQDGFAVIALGKLGGRELNYSSDIDLIFIARRNERVFQLMGQKLIRMLTQVSSEGFLYRVDMRLRPWGRVGVLVPALDEYIHYLHESAKIWEKQALIKARLVTGDEALAIDFFRIATSVIYNLPEDELRAEVLEMKGKIEQTLRKRGQNWGEVKGGKGSIRDVEFVVQYLQLIYGGTYPEVRSRNTMNALGRLRASGILPIADYRIMIEGYIFLRSAEHYLQIMHHQQVHYLPESDKERKYLATRLGFEGEDVGNQLMQRYQDHSSAIRPMYRKYLRKGFKPVSESKSIAIPHVDELHQSRMDISYQLAFNEQEIQHHATLAGLLDQTHLVKVEPRQLNEQEWRLTIVGYDYLGALSLICGLLFEYGLNIIDGRIFTYEPVKERPVQTTVPPKYAKPGRSKKRIDTRRKLVDVFTVQAVNIVIDEHLWKRYTDDLQTQLTQLRAKNLKEVQGMLAQRVAEKFRQLEAVNGMLLPVMIEVDNQASEKYTLLRIDAPDTMGFLFEFTYALGLQGIYIARVMVSSVGNRIHDTLFVTGADGQKITDAQEQRKLRAGTVLVKHFTHLLPHSPNPYSAIVHFREFMAQLFDRPDWSHELASLDRPGVLDALARLLGVSDFLWDDFLRMQYGNLFPIVKDIKEIQNPVSKQTLRTKLNEMLAEAQNLEEQIKILNTYKDREMFRIDMRYIQGYSKRFSAFSDELSDLAEVVIETAYHFNYTYFQKEYGTPMLDTGNRCKITIGALGKLGGRDIGFASDIELLFIFEEEGMTNGSKEITNNEFYNKMVHSINQSIRAKREGIFELDLRLRPYGRAGNVAFPLTLFREYYCPEGPAWDYERQALVLLRPIAGDAALGEEIVKVRDQILFEGISIDIAAMRAMRERQVRQLVPGGTVNAKFSQGGLVDLEYLVQVLQIRHGKEHPELRCTNTSQALRMLVDFEFISEQAYKDLDTAHLFMRRLIDALRMVRGNAKDLTVPASNSSEFAFLARRLDYEDDTAQFLDDLSHHMSKIQKLSLRLLG